MSSKKPDYGQLGSAMRALPNDQWRNYVYHYVTHPPGYGAQVRAARLAGFKGRTPSLMAKIANCIAHDPRMIEAIREESAKVIRAGAPEAVNALYGMIRNPEHKDHARAVAMVLDRVDPQVSHQSVQVTHQIVDDDAEALKELRALRQLDTPRTKLLEIYGGNGLDRLEQREAADNARRADAAKIIDGEYSEVKDV
jgi:hypothetical protein